MAFGVDDAVLAAGITAAGSALAGGASAAASGKLNKKTMAFNREEASKQRLWNEAMADKQNAWNYEMWMKQNEYNSPESQVKRLRDAGLNPLYYGLDGTSAGEITAAQPLGYERAQASNLLNPVSSGLDAASKVAQISNIQADTAKKGEETKTEVQKREQMQTEIEKSKQEINNLLAQEGLTKVQKETAEKSLSWLDRLNTATVAEKESSAALSRSEKNRIESLVDGEKLLQSKSIEDFDHKWEKIDAEITKLSAETGILREDLENYALNHANNGVFGTGLSLPNAIRLWNSHKQKSPDVQKVEADAMATIVDNKY